MVHEGINVSSASYLWGPNPKVEATCANGMHDHWVWMAVNSVPERYRPTFFSKQAYHGRGSTLWWMIYNSGTCGNHTSDPENKNRGKGGVNEKDKVADLVQQVIIVGGQHRGRESVGN